MQPSDPPPADRDTRPEHPDPAVPAALPAAFVRYAVALDAVELAWGYLHARLTAEDAVELAFLRRCDLGTDGIAFERMHRAGASVATGRTAELHAVCREIALAHTARLHRTVDARCLALLRRCPRDTEADMDLWAYVPRRRLPWWLWWHRSVGRRWRAARRRLRRRG
ncbi:hypothetical protein [Streptomyces noursei]|uniref:hypothetical protein n=1 Tax=Streptomyces noursei TaxID=1971 RepID=UPI0038242FBD